MATYVLLGTMVAVYIAELVALDWTRKGRYGFGDVFVWHGLPHVRFDFAFIVNTDWMWRPWSPFTSALSHSPTDFNHLLFNGMFLFFFGPVVERVLGAKRFVVLFLAAGALSGIAQVHAVAYEVLGHPLGYMAGGGALGASGALMAMFGVLMIIMPNEKVSLFMVLPVPLWLAGIGYAALDVLGAFSPRLAGGSNIGHFAHLSGMALGLGYGLWLKQDWKRRGIRLVRA